MNSNKIDAIRFKNTMRGTMAAREYLESGRHHSFRLIDHDEMLILIERLYQTGISHRDNLFRVVLCIKGQANLITFFNRTLPINSLSIDEDVLFRA